MGVRGVTEIRRITCRRRAAGAFGERYFCGEDGVLRCEECNIVRAKGD